MVHAFLRYAGLQVFDVLFADELDTMLEKDLFRRFVIGDAQDNVREFAGDGDERVHILDIDVVIREDLDDLGKSARFIVDRNADDLGDRNKAVRVIKSGFCFVIVGDDQAEDTEIIGIGYAHRADINVRFSDRVGDRYEGTLSVFYENG